MVDPLDPQAQKGGGAKLIDWDLAQTELAEAMGATVDLKVLATVHASRACTSATCIPSCVPRVHVHAQVEEEVAKKRAELDAQLQAMEEKFAHENARLKSELASSNPYACAWAP